jgi:hypothetical protein
MRHGVIAPRLRSGEMATAEPQGTSSAAMVLPLRLRAKTMCGKMINMRYGARKLAELQEMLGALEQSLAGMELADEGRAGIGE